MEYKTASLSLHKKYKGKLATRVVTPVKTKRDMSLVYTPGVGEVSKEIAKNSNRVFDYTIKAHTVAIVSDGSAVLGLGNIGPKAAIPVMEGKAVLFKTFANLDAFPICLDTQDPDEIIKTVKYISPVFGAINLEDISAPRCFDIEKSLQNIGVPVMHDDQHGTAVVVLAGIINAVKVAKKDIKKTKVVILGAGAAGNAIAKIFVNKVQDILVLDRQGILSIKRNDLDIHKKELAKLTNKNNITGKLSDAIKGADIFVGVSGPNLISHNDIQLMADRAIVFALANPIPEILPENAKKAGAFIVATGRSDFPNQVNNSLAFPGIFKGALDAKVKRITMDMKIAAAHALSSMVKNPTPNKIIPGPFDVGVVEKVSSAVYKVAIKRSTV
ncbi:NADP-dependent malic enzyme [Candidatus Woesebacteria bacterium]|nr:MAG: NADP-dependent malic enzyme [Candidatus Woesebacteria bacterium]